MTDLDALQEFEDNAYHQSLKPEVSVGAMACAMSALRERIERNNAQESVLDTRWISVEDRLPETGSNVLIYSTDGHVSEGEYVKELGEWTQYRWSCHPKNVTHWTPLPEPPCKEKK